MAGKPFVFMHYSNPTEDSKRIENRQKVAKYAMLGRQKNPTKNNTNSTARQPGSSPPSSAALCHTSPEWPSTHDPPRHQQQDAIFRSSSRASNSTSDSFHLPSLAQSSPLPTSPLDKHLPCEFVKPVDEFSTSSSLWPSDPIDHGPTDFYTFRDFSNNLPIRSFLDTEQGSSPEHVQERLTSRKRQSKKRHNQAKFLHSSSHSHDFENLSPDCATISRLSSSVYNKNSTGPLIPGPQNLLSATAADPFNALPIKANAHTHELLYQYMNARTISSVYANGSPDTFERIKKMRQTVWGPLTWKSKASLNALVAYVESTPGLPIKSRSQDFLFSHVQASMEGVREALSKPNVATDDSICFAVVLLMLTAQRTGNTKTYAAHAAGLATLLSYRTDAIRKIGEQDDTVDRLQSFYITDPQNQCLYCRFANDGAGSPPGIFPTDVDSFNQAVFPRGDGFRDLVRRGLLTPAMNSFIEPAMIWSTLAERARKDKLSAAIGATHAWIDEGEFSLKGPIHYLDTACFTAVRLCFYLSSWLDWQHSCSAVRRLAKAVHLSLRQADTEYLLVQCPAVLLWLSLMVGPLCEDEARTWFAYLLMQAREAMNLQMWDFAGQVEQSSHLFVWSSTMTPGAERFWHELYFDLDSNQL